MPFDVYSRLRNNAMFARPTPEQDLAVAQQYANDAQGTDIAGGMESVPGGAAGFAGVMGQQLQPSAQRSVAFYGSPRSGDWRPGMGAPAPGRVLGGQGGGSPYPQSPRTGDWRPGMTNPAPGRTDGGQGGGSPYPQSPRTGDYRPGMGSPAPGRGFGGQGGGSPYTPHSPRTGDYRPGSPSPNPGRPIGGYGRVRRMPQPAAPSGPTQQTL